MNSAVYQLLAEYPLEKLLQTIPTGLFLVDSDRKIIYWNSEAERITGFSAAEAVGQDCSFLDGEPCGQSCGLFAEGFTIPEIGLTCSFRHKHGRKVVLSKKVDLLRDKSGKIIGGIEAFIEITRLKEHESFLRQAVAERTGQLEVEKAALRSVLDGMTDPVYICDLDFKIIFINRAMKDIFGDITGHYCYQAIYGEDEGCHDCPMAEVLAGKVVRQEKVLPATGRSYEVIHSPHPLKENPIQKLGVCRDITGRLEVQRQLHQTNRELDAFVSTVSHDLRSPLTPLIGFADLLAERYADQLDEVGRTCVSEIQKTAGKMKALLEDLLSLSRVGQLKLPATPIDATAVAEDVVLELADKILESQARIRISPLPAIRLPEPLLANLFRNLLSNALKYAAHHHPQIEVSGQGLPDRVQYRVSDHGPGIDVDEREMVFEPFKRGRSSQASTGTGIGLATVAKIARVYGGNAWIEETPGGGATFVVDLARQKNIDS